MNGSRWLVGLGAFALVSACTMRKTAKDESSLKDETRVEDHSVGEPKGPPVDESSISFSTFDAPRSIKTNSGERLQATPKFSGAPLIYSSFPEYVATPGKIFTYKLENTPRFRFFMYNVNTQSRGNYIGFAVKNLGNEPIDIYVSRRGFNIGSDSNPALVGREAQEMWYRLADGKDYYVGTANAGAYWVSTQPAGQKQTFPTKTVGPKNGLVQGMYDVAVVGKNSKGPVPYEVISFMSPTQRPNLDTLGAATGKLGANVFCPNSVMSFDLPVDFGGVSGASRYIDIYWPDQQPFERFCKVLAGHDNAYGNYGIDYVFNYKFSNIGKDVVHIAAIAPVGSGNQYYAGAVRHHSGRHIGKSNTLLVNVGGKKVDQGRELAIVRGEGHVQVESQLTGGNYAPLRIYTWTWKD